METHEQKESTKKRKRRKSSESPEHQYNSRSESIEPIRKAYTAPVKANDLVKAQYGQPVNGFDICSRPSQPSSLTYFSRKSKNKSPHTSKNPDEIMFNYSRWLRTQELDVQQEVLESNRTTDLSLGIDWRIRDELDQNAGHCVSHEKSREQEKQSRSGVGQLEFSSNARKHR